MSTASLGGSKIFGEVRVNLKITFPTLDNEALEVRAKPHKLLSQVILHVLQKLQGIFHLTYSRVPSYITVGIMIDELDVRDADSNESIHLDTIVSTMKTNAITVQKASLSQGDRRKSRNFFSPRMRHHAGRHRTDTMGINMAPMAYKNEARSIIL